MTPSILQVYVNGSGYVEVRLKSYRNSNGTDQTGKCCDTKSLKICDPCDPYIQVYLNQGSSGVNLSEIVSTGLYNNTNIIHFGNSTGKISNPFKLTFENFTNKLKLTLVAWDDDRFDISNKSSDKLEELSFNVGQGEPSPFYTHPSFVDKVIKGNAVQLDFEYRISCSQNFYGNCNKFCKPKSGQYNCSKAGQKMCEPGWSGRECDTGPCQSNKCEHNATCIPRQADGYSCSCPPSFSGKFCEIKITPTVTSTTQKQTSSNPVTSTNIATTRSSSSIRQESTSKSTDKIGIIVGCSVAAVFLIAALLTLIVCVLKKQPNRRTNILPNKSS